MVVGCEEEVEKEMEGNIEEETEERGGEGGEGEEERGE